jgi:hypothetical protein
MNAIKSSRIDESRHCDFHPIVPARSKSAAWFMYWLIKLKPIQIKHKSVTIPTEGLYINETFAFFIAIKILKVKSKSLSQRFFKQFVYMLVYRDNMAKPLFITLQLLQIAVERAPELPIE